MAYRPRCTPPTKRTSGSVHEWGCRRSSPTVGPFEEGRVSASHGPPRCPVSSSVPVLGRSPEVNTAERNRQTQKTQVDNWRYGRNGHQTVDCYTKTTMTGTPLPNSSAVAAASSAANTSTSTQGKRKQGDKDSTETPAAKATKSSKNPMRKCEKWPLSGTMTANRIFESPQSAATEGLSHHL